MSRRFFLVSLPILMYLSLLTPFSYLSLFPLFFFVLLMLIPRESGTVMFIGSVVLILFMNYIQLTSPSIILGFFLSGIFATRVKEAEDLEVLVFCLIWLALLSFLGAPYAIYILAATLILFSVAYKKSFVLILLLLLILTPVSLKNWKWWELVGPQSGTTYQQKPVYNRQLDPILKMAGENDSGSGTLSDNGEFFETRYILQLDFILNFLLMLTSLLFIISFLRVLKLAVRYKKSILPDFAIASLLILSSFFFIASLVNFYQAPIFRTEIVKKIVFKFSNPTPSQIAAIGDPLTVPKANLSAPYRYLTWNLDTISRLFGIVIMLVCLYLLFTLARTLFKTALSPEHKTKPDENLFLGEKKFQSKHFYRFKGSDLIKVAYETYRETKDGELDLTPNEFLSKHPNLSLQHLTQEYITTEYGQKPTKIPDETIRSWIKKLEQNLT